LFLLTLAEGDGILGFRRFSVGTISETSFLQPKFIALNSLCQYLVGELIEQGFGVLQVGGVEALGEPVIDFGEHRARFVATALLC